MRAGREDISFGGPGFFNCWSKMLEQFVFYDSFGRQLSLSRSSKLGLLFSIRLFSD